MLLRCLILAGRTPILLNKLRGAIIPAATRFKGQAAIVTGGGGALGRVIVASLLAEGANVAVPYRREVLGLPGEVFMRKADVSVKEDVGAFVDAVGEKFGPPRILINAAGGYSGGRTVDQLDVEEWDRMLAINLRSVFLMSRATLPLMLSAGAGRIISISAMPAIRPSAGRSAYAVAKQGVNTLTEVMADEVKGKGVTVNAIAPGIIATGANRASMPDADTSAWVTPEEIAGVALFLCSDDARFVSGNVIRMFGGL